MLIVLFMSHPCQQHLLIQLSICLFITILYVKRKTRQPKKNGTHTQIFSAYFFLYSFLHIKCIQIRFIKFNDGLNTINGIYSRSLEHICFLTVLVIVAPDYNFRHHPNLHEFSQYFNNIFQPNNKIPMNSTPVRKFSTRNQVD